MSVADPYAKKLRKAADDAPRGPLDRNLADLVEKPKVIAVLRMVVGIDLAIVFLMVAKPGWTSSLVVGATGLALGASLAAVASRRGRQPTPSPVAAE